MNEIDEILLFLNSIEKLEAYIDKTPALLINKADLSEKWTVFEKKKELLPNTCIVLLSETLKYNYIDTSVSKVFSM